MRGQTPVRLSCIPRKSGYMPRYIGNKCLTSRTGKAFWLYVKDLDNGERNALIKISGYPAVYDCGSVPKSDVAKTVVARCMEWLDGADWVADEDKSVFGGAASGKSVESDLREDFAEFEVFDDLEILGDSDDDCAFLTNDSLEAPTALTEGLSGFKFMSILKSDAGKEYRVYSRTVASGTQAIVWNDSAKEFAFVPGTYPIGRRNNDGTRFMLAICGVMNALDVLPDVDPIESLSDPINPSDPFSGYGYTGVDAFRDGEARILKLLSDGGYPLAPMDGWDGSPNALSYEDMIFALEQEQKNLDRCGGVIEIALVGDETRKINYDSFMSRGEIAFNSMVALIEGREVYTVADAEEIRQSYAAKKEADDKNIGAVRLYDHALPDAPYIDTARLTETQAADLDYFIPGVSSLKVPSVSELMARIESSLVGGAFIGVPKSLADPSAAYPYLDAWKGIAQAIRDGEYPCHSFWFAAPSDWAVSECAAEVIRTAFACGLSVTPMVTLGELKTAYEREHRYLNDMELLRGHPRQLRDKVEAFKAFEEAYDYFYYGDIGGKFRPSKRVSAPAYTWEMFTHSDILIIQMPSVGVAEGGIAALSEMMEYRMLRGLTTIFYSSCGLAQLNENCANYIARFVSKTRCRIVKRGERAADIEYFTAFSDDLSAYDQDLVVSAKLRALIDK